MREKEKRPDRDAYSVDGVCQRLGVSRPHFYRLVADGRVRTIKLGRRTLVPASEIARVLGGEAA